MFRAVVGSGALELIEAEFSFLVDEYGFTLAQTSDFPCTAWYRSPLGAVIVRYDPLDDAALDIELEEPDGERYALPELLSLTVRDSERRLGVREPSEFAAEVERMKRLLVVHCDDFLRGVTGAFHTRFREAMLVRACRRLATEEVFGGNPARGAKLAEMYKAYWTEADRELHDRALDGQGPLRYLRAV